MQAALSLSRVNEMKNETWATPLGSCPGFPMRGRDGLASDQGPTTYDPKTTLYPIHNELSFRRQSWKVWTICWFRWS
jgi:hypothetical protein